MHVSLYVCVYICMNICMHFDINYEVFASLCQQLYIKYLKVLDLRHIA